MIYIDISDFFLIAEVVLNRPANALKREANIPVLLSALDAPKASVDGVEMYPSLAEKAAILCIRIARNRPLRRGNSAVAFAAVRKFVDGNGATWTQPPQQEAAAVVEAMAASRIFEAEFILWVNERIA